MGLLQGPSTVRGVIMVPSAPSSSCRWNHLPREAAAFLSVFIHIRSKKNLYYAWTENPPPASFQSKMQKYAVSQVSSIYITVVVLLLKESDLCLNSVERLNLFLRSYSALSQRKYGNAVAVLFFYQLSIHAWIHYSISLGIHNYRQVC